MGFGENFVVQTYQVCNFWTMSVTESQKVAKYSQNKENINYSHGFHVLQKDLISFPRLSK